VGRGLQLPKFAPALALPAAHRRPNFFGRDGVWARWFWRAQRRTWARRGCRRRGRGSQSNPCFLARARR
jgi:hypothetical protein